MVQKPWSGLLRWVAPVVSYPQGWTVVRNSTKEIPSNTTSLDNRTGYVEPKLDEVGLP